MITLYIYNLLIHTKNVIDYCCREEEHEHNARGDNKFDILWHRLVKIINSYNINDIKLFDRLMFTACFAPFKSIILVNSSLINHPFYNILKRKEFNIKMKKCVISCKQILEHEKYFIVV